MQESQPTEGVCVQTPGMEHASTKLLHDKKVKKSKSLKMLVLISTCMIVTLTLESLVFQSEATFNMLLKEQIEMGIQNGEKYFSIIIIICCCNFYNLSKF